MHDFIKERKTEVQFTSSTVSVQLIEQNSKWERK